MKEVVLLLFVGWTAYFAAKQVREERKVARYLKTHQFLPKEELSKSCAERVAASVRREFNTNRSTFVRIGKFREPFLRYDAALLLDVKEGVCGEGTRVIVCLLQKMGFDATRVTLYDQRLRRAHTLVSIFLEDREIFIDSIHSATKTTKVLKEHVISSRNFGFVSSERQRPKTNPSVPTVAEDIGWFLWVYRVYSYEAVPYMKLLGRLLPGVRMFNFRRPGKLIAIVAERPSLIRACLGVAVTVAVSSSILL